MIEQNLENPDGVVCYPKYKKFLSIVNNIALFYVVIVMAISACWLATHYVKPIDGPSMQPGINNYADSATGDIALVSKTATMHHGDIVIVDISKIQSDKNLLIKRTIAMSGDKLKIINDHGFINIYVNDELLIENYIKDPNNQGVDRFENIYIQEGWRTKAQIQQDTDGYYYITIPEGYFFFLGDNRAVSYDSRAIGPVPYSYCEGIVEAIYPRGSFLNNLLNAMF